MKYYAKRENTIWNHIQEIRSHYGLNLFNSEIYEKTKLYLFNIATKNDDTLILMNRAIDYLREQKVILPAITTIEKLVWESKNESEKFVINTIINSLNQIQRKKLDDIVFLHSNKLKGKTILGWLKKPIGAPSPDNFLKAIDKL